MLRSLVMKISTMTNTPSIIKQFELHKNAQVFVTVFYFKCW